MKRAASHLAALQGLLDRDITVALVSEDLHSVEASEAADGVRGRLEDHGYDECGVRRGASVNEYVERTSLATGTVGDYARPVPLDRVVAPSTPLWACMDRLAVQGPLYVRGDADLEGIVTKFDLGKQPARLLMFGVVSLLEMTMLALARRYAGETWQTCLSAARVELATKIHAERCRRREEIDLMDCLQLADKVTIFMRTETLKPLLGESKSEIETLFASLQKLRDNLAHAQSPAADGDWVGVIRTAQKGHHVLKRCVAALLSDGGGSIQACE